MPAYGIFHVGNTLALECLHNDDGGHPLRVASFLERSIKLIKIISVSHLNNMETECREFLTDRIRCIHFLKSAVDLEIIVVNYKTEVIQLSVSCQHSCLPYLTFFKFPVT